MSISSLFISAKEVNAGTLFVSMGMMEILKRNLHRVAFFRPIIYKKDIVDGDISFILKHYNLDIKYDDAYGFDIEYVESMIAQNRINELINELIIKFKKLEKSYDFVLCEGIRKSFLSSNIDIDINLKIAQNFGSSYINIINAKDCSFENIYKSIQIEHKHIIDSGCDHFATFINRVDEDLKNSLIKKIDDNSYLRFYLKEVKELNLPTLLDVIESLNAKEVLVSKKDYTRVIKDVKVAALSVDNFLEHIDDGDLVVVPADRSDIILGLLGAMYSKNYPSISAILFPFNMKAHKNIQKLIDGLDRFKIPIISIEDDTYNSVKKISKVRSRIRVDSHTKIALSLGLFNASVDVSYIEKKISSSNSNIMTPLMFEYKLFEMARAGKKRVVLPESSDERVLRAAEIILMRDVADIILLGNEDEIKEHYLRLGLDLSKAVIIDFKNSPMQKEFVDKFYELRKHKNLTYEAAKDAMLNYNYFATMMVHLGYADAMVSGAIGSTGETVLPALQIIKTKKDVDIVSSLFFMCMKTEVLVYADCAINQNPTAKQLAQIAISSAKTAKSFGIEPKVAMLSYSTGESGHGDDVDRVREATNIVKKTMPELLVEGPIQYDAAVNKSVAKKKLPNSKVAGSANIFIFPDLNTGNNTYKAVQRSSGAVAIGPILQGLNKPVNDLSRGCLVEDIVNTIAITAIQAGDKD